MPLNFCHSSLYTNSYTAMLYNTLCIVRHIAEFTNLHHSMHIQKEKSRKNMMTKAMYSSSLTAADHCPGYFKHNLSMCSVYTLSIWMNYYAEPCNDFDLRFALCENLPVRFVCCLCSVAKREKKKWINKWKWENFGILFHLVAIWFLRACK